ncbi:restriction endonuclease subunit S [Vibrio sp. F13]|uniref:restriction endonuclease subunit S n=1 Tax=Vibrio sp. F13 TaxID=2070777 RepID=UPI001485789B|nr:restriction endonuclease subunit S [Vibrio sp. F13]
MIFDTVKLTAICKTITYGYTASAKTEPDNAKFLRITDIQGGVVDWDSVPYCEATLGQVDKYRLFPGDIVVARTGNSTGENYLFEGDVTAVYASYLIKYSIDENVADPYFVWLQMRTPKWWGFINGAKGGSAQAGANAKVIGNFDVTLPPLEVQKKIVSFVKPYFEKIANNKAMNQTLEKIAQRIFKSWFIDFDPVKANKEGLPFDGLSPEIQALFPNELEDSELGMIPKGWEVPTIKQLQEKLSKGTTPRKKDVESAQDTPSIPFIKVRNISDTGLIESELETVASSIHEGALKRSILQSEDLLFTIAGTIGRVAIVPERLHNSNCNQAVCFIRLKNKSAYNNYIYLHLKSKRIQEQISSKVVQAVQANASLQNINDINVPLPPTELMKDWNKVALPLFDRIKEIEKQNITLTRLRDRLLPKLISGQISVSEAKQELAEAV